MNLDYEKFTSEFLEALKDIMPDAELERVSVEKVNGTKDAVRICLPEHKNVIPTAYLDDLYKAHQAGIPPKDIAGKLSQSILIDSRKIPDKVHFDMEESSGKLFPCVINKEANQKLLSDMPHKDIEGTDLALIARFKIDETPEYAATFMVTNQISAAFRMKPEDVLEQAVSNGSQEKYICRGISEVLADEMKKNGASKEMLEELCSRKNDLCYILSNERMVQGAAVLGYKDKIRKSLKTLGEEKCYILPSSIHEVLLIPGSMAGQSSPEELSDMVRAVNGTEVLPEEQLSNHVYFFDGNNLSIADSQTPDKKTIRAPGIGKNPSGNTKKHEKTKAPTR